MGDDEPLMSAGLDSLGSVEFANVLSQKLGMQASDTRATCSFECVCVCAYARLQAVEGQRYQTGI